MRAVTWHGAGDVRVDTVPDPIILNPHDAIIRVTSTAICGSDLHLYGGYVVGLQPGDILGHETMGEVVEVGPEVTNLRPGDRVVIPFNIACGRCYFCEHDLWSLCDNTNPNAGVLETMYGFSGGGMFGYSHLYGGYAGGQAEYLRVPFANVGPVKIDNGLPDDQVLFLSDIFPTGYMAAENCRIQPGDVIAVWGCGPVGQFAIRSAFMLGAERVITIDRFPDRLHMAEAAGAETIDYQGVDVVEALKQLTGGRGPDACIDAVGMEAHGTTPGAVLDRAKQAVRRSFDRPTVLRQAIQACRKGGVVSIPGVYAGFLDYLPFGAAFAKGLTMAMGQTHVHRYLNPLLREIEQGTIDPSFVITHRLPLESAPEAYRTFREKADNCIKVVLTPGKHAGETNGLSSGHRALDGNGQR